MDGREEELQVVRALENSLGASFERREMVVEALQEDLFLPFHVGAECLSFDRDFWSGLTILAESEAADRVLLQIRGILADSSPPRRSAGDENTVVSRQFLEWLLTEPGAADLTCWR